jgi:hypothetical protein
LVKTFVEQARTILTFILGQIHSLHELLAFVPKEGEEFLHFSTTKELQDIDGEGIITTS